MPVIHIKQNLSYQVWTAKLLETFPMDDSDNIIGFLHSAITNNVSDRGNEARPGEQQNSFLFAPHYTT